MIHLKNITVAFESKSLLDGVSCHFASGTLCALVGRNGAGKSSLLKVLAAIDSPKSGEVIVGGRRPDPYPLSHVAVHRIKCNSDRAGGEASVV